MDISTWFSTVGRCNFLSFLLQVREKIGADIQHSRALPKVKGQLFLRTELGSMEFGEGM